MSLVIHFLTLMSSIYDSFLFNYIFGLKIHLPLTPSNVKLGHWKFKIDEIHFGVDVHHKVLGIGGMGRVGSAITKRAHFGIAS